MSDNYTLGRGEIYFAPFATGTETPLGEMYLGNTPEFNLTIEEDKLEHYSSDRGIKEKDASISLQVNRSGSLTTDNISPSNVALFFFGSADALAVTGATVTDEVVSAVKKDRYYQLGMTQANPSGARELDYMVAGTTKVVVTNSAGAVTYTEGTDYTIDLVLGRLYIPATSTVVEGADLKVDYKTKTSTRTRILSGSTAIKGALRYVAKNAQGSNMDYYMPYVSLSPNGDFALKGDEFQQIPFNVEVLKKTGYEAIYVDGRAVAS